MKQNELFIKIGEAIDNSKLSHMFGKPCFKVGGKAFVCFYENEMVFKLSGDHHKDALSLEGAQLFDPSGKGRAMKEWVQVPFVHNDLWSQMAKQSLEYVKTKYKIET